MNKPKRRTISSQYRLYACIILSLALFLTGMVSYVIFRGMYADRRDQYSVESLTVATDELTAACDDMAYKAVGIHALLGDLAAAYCQSDNASSRLEYYRQIGIAFGNSVYASEYYSQSYGIYLIFPDGTQIAWGQLQNVWQGKYSLFNTLPRQKLAINLPAGAVADTTLWLYENNASFGNLLFFALEIPAENMSYLIVIGVHPNTVFQSGNYTHMALFLHNGALLPFSRDNPFGGTNTSPLKDRMIDAGSGKIGSLAYRNQTWMIYGKVSSHLGTLLMAVPVSAAYPQLHYVALLYAAAGILLFLLFGTLNWRMSSAVAAPITRLSQALEQNEIPLARSITLSQPTGLLHRWMDRYSTRAKLMLFYIAGSIVPAMLYLIFCAILTQNIIAGTFMANVNESISYASQSISKQMKTIQELGKSIIFMDDTQALMMSPAGSANTGPYRDRLTEYLLILQPDVSHTNTLFINVYNLDGTLLYSTHNIFTFSDDFALRAGSFAANTRMTRQWLYESVGNTSIYSYYRKAYKKSVDPQVKSDVPVNPIGFPQIGYLQVGLLEPTLRNSYALLSSTEGIDCMILDNFGTIISNYDSHLIGLSVTQAYPDDSQPKQASPFRYTIRQNIEESDGWILYIRVEDRQLQEASLRILFLSSYVLFIVMGLVSLSTWLILTRIKSPFNQLMLLTQRQNSVQLPAPYVYTGHTNEISTLVDSFNRMLARLQEQIDIRQTVEKQKQEAELIALQSQINPHFLYNVFTSINFTMLRGKTDDAASMLDMVGRLFRIGIYRGHPIVAMEEEIRHINTYLDIQLIRYSHKLTVHYDLNPAIYQYDILKLTLQPLVENSIYHGIEIKEGSGTILISARVLPDRLQFTIKDDGVGIEKDELAELQNGLSQRNLSRGIGLNNVNERIKMYFGSQYGLVIESVQQGGTTVIMTMPLIRHEPKE